MALATAAVLSESQPSNEESQMPALPSWTSHWRLRRDTESPPPCLLTDYIETALWKQAALSKIRNLRWLDAGWDGPDSEPIPCGAIELAYQLTANVADALPGIAEPSIFPTPYFGVLIEWHTPVRDFAFTIQRDGSLEVDYQDSTQNLEWEGAFVDLPDDSWGAVLANCRR